MAKSYVYQVLRKDKYKVLRVDDSKKGKERFQEYLVDLANGDMLCDCKGFYYSKKACKHVKFILAQLAGGGGILEFEKIGDIDRLIKSIKKEKRGLIK